MSTLIVVVTIIAISTRMKRKTIFIYFYSTKLQKEVTRRVTFVC